MKHAIALVLALLCAFFPLSVCRDVLPGDISGLLAEIHAANIGLYDPFVSIVKNRDTSYTGIFLDDMIEIVELNSKKTIKAVANDSIASLLTFTDTPEVYVLTRDRQRAAQSVVSATYRNDVWQQVSVGGKPAFFVKAQELVEEIKKETQTALTPQVYFIRAWQYLLIIIPGREYIFHMSGNFGLSSPMAIPISTGDFIEEMRSYYRDDDIRTQIFMNLSQPYEVELPMGYLWGGVALFIVIGFVWTVIYKKRRAKEKEHDI